jgi:hypothetical protein
LLGPRAFRYPREGLLNSLAVLLWSPELISSQCEWLSIQLNSPITNQAEALMAYEKLWHRFN